MLAVVGVALLAFTLGFMRGELAAIGEYYPRALEAGASAAAVKARGGSDDEAMAAAAAMRHHESETTFMQIVFSAGLFTLIMAAMPAKWWSYSLQMRMDKAGNPPGGVTDDQSA